MRSRLRRTFVAGFGVCAIALAGAQLVGVPAAFANAPQNDVSDLAAQASKGPLQHAHSHNDENRDHPLRDALDHGFASVEADVWLAGGQLMVSHNQPVSVGLSVYPPPDHTLQNMYLNPLRKLVDRQGSVVPGLRHPFQLVIELKGPGSDQTASCRAENGALWAAVHTALEPMRRGGYLATYNNGVVNDKRPIQVVYTGHVPRDCVVNQRGERAEFIDDASINSKYSAAVQPAVTVSYDNYRGASLADLVARAHKAGKRVRVWFGNESDDTESSWRDEINARVDYIGTDHLTRLDTVLRPRDSSY